MPHSAISRTCVHVIVGVWDSAFDRIPSGLPIFEPMMKNVAFSPASRNIG